MDPESFVIALKVCNRFGFTPTRTELMIPDLSNRRHSYIIRKNIYRFIMLTVNLIYLYYFNTK